MNIKNKNDEIMSKNKNETYLNIFIRKEEDKFFERGVILYA